MKDLTSETDLENRFRAWVKKQKGKTYKWTGSKEKLDLIVVTHTGVIGLLEVKHPNGRGRLSPQQEKIISEIGKRTPGVAVSGNDFEQLKSWYYTTSIGLYLKISEHDL